MSDHNAAVMDNGIVIESADRLKHARIGLVTAQLQPRGDMQTELMTPTRSAATTLEPGEGVLSRGKGRIVGLRESR